MTLSRPTKTLVFVGALILSFIIFFTPGSDARAPIPGLDKVIHFSTFTLLAAATALRFGVNKAAVLALLVYAPLSEVVQLHFIPLREFDVMDIAFDSAGLWPMILWRKRG